MGYFSAILRPRLHFDIRTIFMAMVVVGLACLLYRYSPAVFWTALIGGAAANLLGWVAGWFVTVILGLPNDGSDPLGEDAESCPRNGC